MVEKVNGGLNEIAEAAKQQGKKIRFAELSKEHQDEIKDALKKGQRKEFESTAISVDKKGGAL